MVPAVSRRIPRVLRYSGGGPAARVRFAYGAFTLCGRRFHAVRLRTGRLSTAAPTTPAGASPRPRFGLLRFRSPLLAESLLFSSPAGTEMFQFPALAPLKVVSSRTGSPIRTPADLAVFAGPRGFSQLVTSFLASGSLRHPPCALLRFPFVFSGSPSRKGWGAFVSVVFYSLLLLFHLRVHHVNDLPFSWRITDSNR